MSTSPTTQNITCCYMQDKESEKQIKRTNYASYFPPKDNPKTKRDAIINEEEISNLPKTQGPLTTSSLQKKRTQFTRVLLKLFLC